MRSNTNDTNSQFIMSDSTEGIFISMTSGYPGSMGPGSGQIAGIAFSGPAQSGIQFGKADDFNFTNFAPTFLAGYNQIRIYNIASFIVEGNINYIDNAQRGTATLSSGTVTISYSAANNNTRCQMWHGPNAGSLTNVGELNYNVTNGTSVTIRSANVLDASVVTYIIYESQ